MTEIWCCPYCGETLIAPYAKIGCRNGCEPIVIPLHIFGIAAIVMMIACLILRDHGYL